MNHDECLVLLIRVQISFLSYIIPQVFVDYVVVLGECGVHVIFGTDNFTSQRFHFTEEFILCCGLATDKQRTGQYWSYGTDSVYWSYHDIGTVRICGTLKTVVSIILMI